MNLLWVTDPHLNFIPSALEVGRNMRKTALDDAEGVLITGDISEAPMLRRDLEDFQKGVELPVYFVLGNHDYYRGSFGGTALDVQSWGNPNLKWLTTSKPIVMGEKVLCGVDGWYDGMAGNVQLSQVRLSDFSLIKELRGLRFEELLHEIRNRAMAQAKMAEARLRQAVTMGDRIVFATHVPPFPGSSWHEGKISDHHYLPWMCAPILGETIWRVSTEFPNHSFEVFCGHTHSRGEYQPTDNLIVYTGQSVYGKPRISGHITDGVPLV